MVGLAVFSLSICAFAAQIDSLSIIDNTIYATVTGENATFYAAAYNDEGLLSAVFSTACRDDGKVELAVTEASAYKLFMWDKEKMLAPISCVYILKDGVAYEQDSSTPVPEYKFSEYSFDQEDNVMIVSQISETSITGFKAGAEATYTLAESVTVLGLSDSLNDVVPGSVVLIGTNSFGECAAIELVASIGIPIDPTNFEADFGVYAASDNSSKYSNILTMAVAKSGGNLTTQNPPDSTKTKYTFDASAMAYRVGIAMDGDTPVISFTSAKGNQSPNPIFPSTAEDHIYLYLRYNNESSRIKEAVLYCVPKDLDFTDPEYPMIPYSSEPIVIIE